VWPKMLAMGAERSDRGRVEGARRRPQACRATSLGQLARWTHIRDGLREVIEFLPVGERALEAPLQRLWAEVDLRVARLDGDGGGEWLIQS